MLKASQLLLEPREIVVPFADRVAGLFSFDRVDARRNFGHLLQLVRASALLHQRQRQVDADGCVIAAAADYQLAARLAAKPMARAAGGVSDAAREVFAAIRRHLDGKDWSLPDVIKTGGLKMSPRSVYGRVNELHDAGAVEQVTPSKGKVPAVWRLTGTDPDAGVSPVPALADVFRDEAKAKP